MTPWPLGPKGNCLHVFARDDGFSFRKPGCGDWEETAFLKAKDDKEKDKLSS